MLSCHAVLLFSTIITVSALSWQDLPPSGRAKSAFRKVKQEWISPNASVLAIEEDFEASFPYAEGNLTEYEYLPLAEQHIRLLRVARKGLAKDFSFELVHVVLNAAVIPYLAISYTWGDQTSTHSLFSSRDQRYLNVSPSVTAFLDTLLDVGDYATLWVDAVCINQQDPVEKGHQVRLMREIYHRAVQVVISLGSASVDSGLAMDFVESLRSGIEGLYQENKQILKEDLLRNLGLKFPDPTWTALRNLFDRPWFGRIWIIQEVVYGRRPVFVLGDRAVEWLSMAFVASRLFDQGLLSLVEYDHEDLTVQQHYPTGVRSIVEIHSARDIKQNKERESFQEMLMAFHHFGTTNEADKVFALLGLATDTTDTMLNPDYTISVEDVYIKTARHLLLRDQSILILHRAGVGFPNRNETLPSWVPDWRSFSEDNSFGTMHTIAGYRAGGEHTSGVSIGSTNDSLVFEGLLVDVVEQVGSVRTPLTDKVDHTVHQHNSEFFAWLIEAESMVEKLENRKATPLGTAAWYSKNETLNDALCRTLVANNILTNPSKLREHCGFWGQHIANLAENVSEPMSEERWKVVVAYDDACTRTTMGRKFFITRNGFMGVTSPGTLPGDAVAIFLGGKTPFITRDSLHAQGGHAFSTLVGEAYVHGLMKGEGLDLAQVRELEFR